MTEPRRTREQIEAHQIEIYTEANVTYIRCQQCREILGDSRMWAKIEGDVMPVIDEIIATHRALA